MVSLPHRSQPVHLYPPNTVLRATSKWVLLLLLLAMRAPTQVDAQSPPTISHAQPSAIDPRTTTRLAIHGDQFVAPIRILWSVPVKSSIVEVSTKKVVIDVTPDSELPLGSIGMWIASDQGITAPLALLVDPLPTITEATDNHGPLSAQSIGAGSAIDGVADGKQFDFFRFHADQDQEITFEVLAQHIGSACDPVVRLLREEEARLVRSIDDDANSSDCRFRHRFDKAGNYLLEVHDNRYRAGGRYRLRMGQLPLVTFAYPPVVQRGTCAEIRFAGPDSSSLASSSVTVPDDARLSTMNVTAIDKRTGAAAWSSVALSDSIQMIESEPNDVLQQANSIESARGISGLLEKVGDHDYFRFTATKDQSWRFVARSRSFGSATILKMTLYNATGAVLAKSAVSDADEPQLDFKFPSDGEYLLELHDLVERGGTDHGYHLAIETQPSFELQLKPDAANRDSWFIQPTGGAASFPILIQRKGYDGAIDLQLSPEVPGLKLQTKTLPAGSKEATLTLLSTAEFEPQCLQRVRILGTAATPPADQKVTSWLSSSALSVQRAPHQPFPPAWLTSSISIAGVVDAPPLFTWAEVAPPAEGGSPKTVADAITTNTMSLIRATADGTLKLTIKRNLKEFKGPVTLISSELPKGWSVTSKLDKEVMTLSVKHPTEELKNAAADGKPEPQQLKLKFFAEHSGRGQLIETVVPVKLVTPLTLNLLSLKAMKAGETQTVSVEIVREAIDNQPVTVRLQNLPKGVSAPEVATIPADQNKVDIAITVAADAEAVEASNVVITATTKNGDKEWMASSPPLTLRISRPD